VSTPKGHVLFIGETYSACLQYITNGFRFYAEEESNEFNLTMLVLEKEEIILSLSKLVRFM
jgi:hypothetical protein